jgi:LytS/YehU family sensor histidine kinase
VGVFIAASTGIKLFQKWIIDSQKMNEMEKLTMQVEMEQLKNQINPHFLFNMLNNVNVLILKDPQKASHILLVLSDLLRYQLYDTSRTNVMLSADINFITDFLKLESVRHDNFNFNVTCDGEVDNVLIAPLLFIPFVENATKHNDYGEKVSYVDVHFSLKDGMLHFLCKNSKSKNSKSATENGGLGLYNIKRRLELLYPDAHELLIQNNESEYIVNLYIKL